MADAADSKSAAPCGRVGSTPISGTTGLLTLPHSYRGVDPAGNGNDERALRHAALVFQASALHISLPPCVFSRTPYTFLFADCVSRSPPSLPAAPDYTFLLAKCVSRSPPRPILRSPYTFLFPPCVFFLTPYTFFFADCVSRSPPSLPATPLYTFLLAKCVSRSPPRPIPRPPYTFPIRECVGRIEKYRGRSQKCVDASPRSTHFRSSDVYRRRGDAGLHRPPPRAISALPVPEVRGDPGRRRRASRTAWKPSSRWASSLRGMRTSWRKTRMSSTWWANSRTRRTSSQDSRLGRSFGLRISSSSFSPRSAQYFR